MGAPKKKRKIIRDKLIRLIAPGLVLLIDWFIGLSCKKHWYGLENLELLRSRNQRWIYSIWHNNVLMSPWLLRNQDTGIMVSHSKEGEIIAKVVVALNNKPFRGSTSKGALKALHGLIKYVKSGKNGAITPDGPRGPKYVLQAGALSLAQKSGAFLVPFHYEATRQWVFSSWDHHKVPKPFSDLVICLGEPYFVPEELEKEDFESTRLEFQRQMMENVTKTETIVKELKTKKGIA